MVYFCIRCVLWVLKCRRLDLFAVSPSILAKNYWLCEKHFDKETLQLGYAEFQENALPSLFDFPHIRFTVPLLAATNSSVRPLPTVLSISYFEQIK